MGTISRTTLTCMVGCLAAVLCLPPTNRAHAEPVADFYRGRSVTLVIGYSAGGGYDAYGRVLARHLGRHIPGNPAIVAQNMPGAGSLRAANYLYNVAPKDGTALGVVTQTLMIEGPLGTPGVKYEAAEFSYLGRMTSVLDTISSWHQAKART